MDKPFAEKSYQINVFNMGIKVILQHPPQVMIYDIDDTCSATYSYQSIKLCECVRV